MTAQPDNRTTTRRSTAKSGDIVFHAGRAKIGCMVRDISAKGARLEVRPGAPPVPASFDLVLPSMLRQPCKVAWRKGREIGVTFV